MLLGFFEFNVLVWMFLFYSFTVTVGGVLLKYISCYGSGIPHLLHQAFKFGKLSENKSSNFFLKYIQVPRRCFVHFYILGAIIITTVDAVICKVYLQEDGKSSELQFILDYLTVHGRQITVDKLTTAVSAFLLSLQIYRRLYENLYVSVFSDGKMNLFHYTVGVTHYVGAISLLIAESPGFAAKGFVLSESFRLRHILGISVYVFGFFLQKYSIQALANLRKTHAGVVDFGKVSMPHGGPFEYVSCPHMLAECLIYVSIYIILGVLQHYWAVVLIWVICNQVQVAVMNHRWYKENFKDVPHHRRAIIPYIL